MINVYLNAALIYGSDKITQYFADLGIPRIAVLWNWAPFPALEVKGAAIATLIAFIWMAFHYFLYLFKERIKIFIPFTFGLTIGNKWFRKSDKIGKESWSRYSYYDLQSHSLESIIQPGIGFGLIRGDNMPLTPSIKLWAGWLVLGSYEFINMKNDDSKHYYGLFGVLPLPIGVSGV